MSKDFTTSYAAIIKQEKQDDGTLMVYGKATDDSVDIDLQICDAAWLNRAMPEWFKTGGNIREQHSNIAAGVAKELDSTGDGHYISALVVDPVSVKKVETGVLKGFSIGIRAPRVVRDQKAANGRIIDGQIVEISLVDRPANPNAKLMLAKSVEGEATLVQVEELTEIKKHGDHDQSDHNPTGGGGSSSDKKDGSREPSADTQKNISNLNVDLRGVASDVDDAASEDKSIRSASVQIDTAMEHIDSAENAKTADEAKDQLDMAERNLSNAVSVLEANHYLQEASNVYARAKDVASASQAIKNGTWKSLTLKHGDHDQSDHNPNGGGGSDSKDPDSMEAQQARGRDDDHVEGITDNLRDINSEMDDTIDDMSGNEDDSDMYGAQVDIIESAQTDIGRAQAALDDATRPDTLVDHANNLEEARTHLENAERKLGFGDEDAKEYATSVRTAINDITGYLGELDNSKSVIGNLKKEQLLDAETTNAKERTMTRRANKASEKEEPKDKAVSEKPSKDEMMKRLEDAKNAYMAAEKECKDAGFLDDKDEEKALKPVGETAEEETEEGSKPEAAEEEVEEAEGKKKIKAKKKSIDTVVPEPDTIEVGDTEKEDDEEDEIGFEQKTINAIIEKAVKSATESVRNEIDILKSANEADKEIINKLQDELASANQKAVNGGPKRSVIKQQNAVSEYATMALTYRQKAAATSDKTLALGYKELAKDFEAKAAAVAE